MRNITSHRIGLWFLAIMATVQVCIGLAGCASASDLDPETPVPELTPGEDRQDSLLPGSTSTLLMPVNARTFYAVWLSASGGSDINVTLTGSPLAAPVEVNLSSRNDPPTEPQGTFYAQSDGDLQIVVANYAQPTPEDAGLIDSILFGDDTPTNTTLRIDDLGIDDHGDAAGEATAMVPDGRSIGGALVYGEIYDYFTLPVQPGDLFNVKVEATRELTLATANIDSFGQFNFNVATNAGNRLSLTSMPGVPAANQFAITAAESTGSVLLAVAVKAPSDLLSDSLTFPDYPVEYVITVEQVTSQPSVAELTPGEDRQDSLLPGGTSTLLMPVKARTYYAVWLSASGGSNVGVTLTGTPLVEPLDLKLSFLDAFSTEPKGTFYTRSDGDLQIVISNNAQPVAEGTGLIDSTLMGGDTPTITTLRIDDLGSDDHGETPGEATAILPSGQSVGGTLVYGETYDYFTLPVRLGQLFNVKVEATRDLTLATANIDSFGQFNFNVATNAGNRLSLTSKPGVPAADQFAIIAAEPSGAVLLAVKVSSGLLAGSLAFSDYPITYAITVEEVTSQQLQSGDARSGYLEAGFTAQFFIDVPSALSKLHATLSGPDGLALYVRKGQPASFEEFDFYMVLASGVATDTITIAPPKIKADRYYMTVGNILGQAANYILAVEIE